MMQTVTIGTRHIGPGQPCYVVAELSANHRQRLEDAVALIRAARRAGADAVKLQTYTPDTLTIDCDSEWFKIPSGSPWAGKTLYELYREAYMPWEWHPRLVQAAREEGMDCFSTPFDATAVDFLEPLGLPAYKVASFEAVDLPLLRRIGRTGKPVILSTGLASFEEIQEAVQTLRQAGTRDLVILKCTSAYPAPIGEMNLRTIPHLSAAFDIPAGLSDHTQGTVAAVAQLAGAAAMVGFGQWYARRVSPRRFHFTEKAVCSVAALGIVLAADRLALPLPGRIAVAAVVMVPYLLSQWHRRSVLFPLASARVPSLTTDRAAVSVGNPAISDTSSPAGMVPARSEPS